MESSNRIELGNGNIWSAFDFQKHYLDGTGTPVVVGMKWYMTYGAGRYANPSQFKIIQDIVSRNDLKPGNAYNILNLSQSTSDITAVINQSKTDVGALDYFTRVMVNGKTAFRIVSGHSSGPAHASLETPPLLYSRRPFFWPRPREPGGASARPTRPPGALSAGRHPL